MAQRVISLNYNKVSRCMNTATRQDKTDPKKTKKRVADVLNDMQFPKEQSEVSHGHGRPAEEERLKIAEAAEARAKATAAKIREAKAKDERQKEAARKAAEEEIESKKRAAAAASEALEKATEKKSAHVREAARAAAAERAAVAAENHCLLPENHTVTTASVPSHNMEEKEIINAPSNKHILKESSEENTNFGNSNEREARAKAQRAREAARKAENEKIEAKKRAAAVAGDALEKTEAIKSTQAREAARAAAEARLTIASQKPQNYSINAASYQSQNKIQRNETVNATSEQCYLKERNKGNSNHGRLDAGEIHGSIKQEILSSPVPGSLKTAVKEKETVNVRNENHTLLESGEEKVSHSNSMNHPTEDQESRQKIKSVYEEDYHAKQSGARPKERNVEHSKHANNSQSKQNNNQQNCSTIKQNERSRYSPEKEIVSVTRDERNRSKQLGSTGDEDQSQYVEVGNPPKMNDTEMEESKQKYNQNFQSEIYPGDGRALGVLDSHQYQGKYYRRTQPYYAPPTQRNRGFEHTHQQHCSTYHNQHQNHHSCSRKQQSHYNSYNYHHHAQQQMQQRPPFHGSSRNLVCASCHEEYDLRERVPRNLHCGHSICTLCIRTQINSDFKISCPHCPVETRNIKTATWCPVNGLLMKILAGEIKKGFVKGKTWECIKPHLFASSDGRQSRPQHGNDGTVGSGIMQSGIKSEGVEYNAPQRSPHGSKCLDMGVRPSHYCSACMVWVCAKCAEAEHKIRKCSLIPLKEQLSEMKQKYEVIGKRTQELLRKSQQSLENNCDQEKIFLLWMRAAFESMEKKQENLKKALQAGTELMDTLTDVMKSVPDAQNLPEALTTFQLMEDVASEANQWSSSDEFSAIDADQEVTACLKHLMKRTLKSLQVENGICEMFASDKIPGGELFSEVRVDGGRFHLHSLKPGKPTKHGTRALPLQCFKPCQAAASTLVFLDLSWRGKCHGRLYIRLTGDTLRGRQFLSLCTGEGGVSFCGTRFHRVWWKGLPGEHVWTGDYEKGDGSGGKTRLSSSSQVQVPAGREVPISAGLVAGRYEKENLSSIFRIYTREEKEVRDEAGFGQVEFGLDVVKEAVRLRDISDVMISDCGLVLEM